MYDVKPVEAAPVIVAERKSSPYPFDKMTEVGLGFVVPASDADDFKKVRMLASKYATRKKVVISCRTLTDGSMQVRLDAKVRPERAAKPLTTNVAPVVGSTPTVQPVGAVQVNDAPTPEQFKQHLSHFVAGQTQLIAARYSAYFDPMRVWIDELKQETGKRYYCIGGPDGTLQIGLQAESGKFFETTIDENTTDADRLRDGMEIDAE